MSRARAAAVGLALAAGLLALPRAARADYWSYEPDDDGSRAHQRVRVHPFASFWAATFDRPGRACKPFLFGFGIEERPSDSPTAIDFGLRRQGLREQQGVARPPSSSCASDDSDEIGFSGGIGVTIRVIEPLHLTAGIEFVYTFPERDFILKNQLVIPVPLGVMITWPELPLRPILAARAVPLLYVTDDSRDYSLGGEAGLAWRMPEIGDLTFTVAHHRASTMIGWQVLLGILPF